MAKFERAIVSALDKGASLLGLRLIPEWRLHEEPQRNYLRRLFHEWAISSVVDVGANAGQYRDFLRGEVGFTGPILSIEPIPELVSKLRARVDADSMWRIEQCALGSEPGNASFNVTGNTEFSSLLSAAEFSENYFETKSKVQRTIDVTIHTLDELTTKHKDFLGDKLYLKLDTQGYDLQVLSGLQSEFHRVIAAQTEAAVVPLYKGAPDYVKTIQAFKDRDFTVSGFFPNNAGHFPLLLEFDCHFVKLPSDSKARATS